MLLEIGDRIVGSIGLRKFTGLSGSAWLVSVTLGPGTKSYLLVKTWSPDYWRFPIVKLNYWSKFVRPRNCFVDFDSWYSIVARLFYLTGEDSVSGISSDRMIYWMFYRVGDLNYLGILTTGTILSRVFVKITLLAY